MKVTAVDTPKFVKMILDIAGPTLKKLDFKYGCDVDMDYLASTCPTLEHLTFDATNVINDLVTASRWSPETFLPKLKHFRTRNTLRKCLEFWSAIIETKSTLAHLSLQCCHIGTDVIPFAYYYYFFLI